MSILEAYHHCTICPHQCGVDRYGSHRGICRAPARPKIAKTMLHHWEEPCISGTRGSGTVFFSHCNLGCLFCQNYEISHQGLGEEVSEETLAKIFFSLQEQGAHNLNLVSPTPYLPSIAVSLDLAKNKGLEIPVVYNTNGYELPASLAILNGFVDIYLPDLKYYQRENAQKLAGAGDYFSWATAAITAMFEAVGPTMIGADGLLQKGLLIRHLILPGHLAESKRILDWVKSAIPETVYLSLMSQYFPTFQSHVLPALNRRLTQAEYDEVLDYFLEIGLINGFSQELTSATKDFLPQFED